MKQWHYSLMEKKEDILIKRTEMEGSWHLIKEEAAVAIEAVRITNLANGFGSKVTRFNSLEFFFRFLNLAGAPSAHLNLKFMQILDFNDYISLFACWRTLSFSLYPSLALFMAFRFGAICIRVEHITLVKERYIYILF